MAIDQIEEFSFLLTISVNNEQEVELTSGILAYFDVEAFLIEGGTIHIYHYSKDYLDGLSAEILECASWISPDSLSISRVANENWNEKWESSFKPIVVDDFCAVKASFHQSVPEAKYVLTIDPEMAFGTGHHETTYSMIKMMALLDFRGKTVLDFGTGTGILAILAEKLGASGVLAFDFDQKAVNSSLTNIGKNGCTKIECLTAEIFEIPETPKYDIVLANVNRNVLIDASHEVALRTKPGGLALLSGLLNEDEGGIIQEYQKSGFKHQSSIHNGDWCCVLLKKS